jgi:hypothetical protein
MPNWNSVLKEISQTNESPFDRVRRKYLRLLERHTKRNVIAYYSGYLTKPRIEGVEINDEDKNGFMLCIHELDKKKGLDLILHTPGGDVHATISLVDYLRGIFGSNLRAIIPQIAMSAGTMIALSCKEIVMGKHSSLGPVDPQFGVIAAANLLEEVKKARNDIMINPNLAAFWNPILSKITPSFLERCEWAIQDANEFLTTTLKQNMFSGLSANVQSEKIDQITATFANNEGRAHNTHIQYEQCLETGLNVSRLEDDERLQDLILTVHHCYMHTLSNTAAFKVIENHLGRAMVRQQVQIGQVPIATQPGGAV